MVFMTIATMMFSYQMLPGSDYTLVITSVTMQDDAKFQCQVLLSPERKITQAREAQWSGSVVTLRSPSKCTMSRSNTINLTDSVAMQKF